LVTRRVDSCISVELLSNDVLLLLCGSVLRRDSVLFGVSEDARSFSLPANDDMAFTEPLPSTCKKNNKMGITGITGIIFYVEVWETYTQGGN